MVDSVLVFPEVEGYISDLSKSAGVSGGVSFARGKALDGTEYSLGARNFYDSTRFFYLKEVWGDGKVVCGSSDIHMLMGHLKEEFGSDPGMMRLVVEAELMLGIGNEEIGHGKMCKCKACGTEIDLEDEEGLWGHLQLDHEDLFEECMDWETPDMIEEFYEVQGVMNNDLTFVELNGDIAFYEDSEGNQFQQIKTGELFPVVDGEMQYKEIYTLGNYTLKYNLNGVDGFAIFKGEGILEAGVWNLKDAIASMEEFHSMDRKPGLAEKIQDAEGKKHGMGYSDFSGKDDFER